MSKSVHRIGVNGVRWNVRVPRWFAMKVWLWIPGKWHWQMCTGPVVRPGPIFARGISSDSWGCTACAHRSDSWPEYDAHKAVHHPTVSGGMTVPDGLDPSHDWHQFEEGEPPENLFCHRCEICTCHSPEASRERCDFAEYASPEQKDSDS